MGWDEMNETRLWQGNQAFLYLLPSFVAGMARQHSRMHDAVARTSVYQMPIAR